jgi:hypothetical protein
MQRWFYDNEFSLTHHKLYEIKSLIQELIIEVNQQENL